MESLKKDYHHKIKYNIAQYGHHINIVSNGAEPRFAYTIGATVRLGFELVFAGGIFYMQDEIIEIINEIILQLNLNKGVIDFKIRDLGHFKLLPASDSWTRLMMLGYFDYYAVDKVNAMQIMPDTDHITLDVPNMVKDYNILTEPVWKWLSKDWNYNIPENSKVITNIGSLRGKTITEVMRWEADEWEAFAGNGTEVEEKDIRIVPLGTILGLDSALDAILQLEVGKGIWRDDDDLVWHVWE